jgi:uncharacterized protein (TIGR03067 family)
MSRLTLAGVVFALGVAGPLLADEPGLAALAGSYKAASLLKDGKEAPADLVAAVAAKIEKDEITFTVKGKEFPAKLRVDPKKAPAHLDLSPADGPDKGRTFPGLYKVEKGELVLAFTERSDRPADFAGGPDVLVVRLKKDGK